MFDDFDTQIQVEELEEVICDDMVLIKPENYDKFLRSKGIQIGRNNIIDFL